MRPSRPNEGIDGGHASRRAKLRVIGPIVVVVGGIMLIIGVVDFFGAFRSFGKSPSLFWCAFVGMFVLMIGLVLSKFGYMGAITRYVANEVAPVGKDTFNYLADGTQQGVKTITKAVGEGLREGMGGGAAGGGGGRASVMVRCHKCNAENDADAKFCDHCGAPLSKSKACPSCNELNDPDARFCDNCGREFT